MGMPRRMEHYDYAGLAALADRRRAWRRSRSRSASLPCRCSSSSAFKNQRALAAGADDPWDGRTLEWATASPPAPYNFAIIPKVTALDAVWEMKKVGLPSPPSGYPEIFLPRNSADGIMIGALSFIFGFAMVWYIWWLAGATLLAILAVVVARMFDQRPAIRLSPQDVAVIERARA